VQARLERWLGRYFFDVDEGERQVRDDVGKNLIDRELAVFEAGLLLQSLLEIRRITGRPGTTYVRVRDANGRRIYEGSIHFEA
jgi:hypothetical protein